MGVDPTKAVLFIDGKQVRYKQGSMNGVIKSFNFKPVSAVFQGIDVIVTLDNGWVRRIVGPSYNMDMSV
tara:strand:+ start:305 stop:511 length:207 start_codon:yes stop_codon:yes gene_type:complete